MKSLFIPTVTIILSLVSSFNLLAKSDPSGIADKVELIRPLLPGQVLTNVCLQDVSNKQICTEKLFADKPTVLIVYRGGWCPYCNAQLNQIKSVEKGIVQLGYQVIAVSPDSNKNVAEQQSREKINHTLLADTEMNLAKALGLAFFLDSKTEAMYRERLGVPFVDFEGESRVALPAPAIYIFDTEGRVHFQYVNPDYKVRLNEKLLLSAARLLRKDLD
ncbi:MAG: AhpC/TSA family protein [Gammaproteobacteria bacterium]|nr:AhpC/TSA family protein [Gammaproteobacteria bacterium]